MNAFFGEPWDVPATEGQPHVPTPVGTPCGHCAVPVETRDRGFLLPFRRPDLNGKPYTAVEPWHRECLLRATVGSPGHLDGHCTCRGDAPHARPQTPAEMRAEAIEVWDRITSGRL